MRLPLVYPIVDVETLAARGLEVELFARELLEGGAEILQLRNKGGSPQEILAQAALISKLAEGKDCVLVMNDRADLAVLAGWCAVHVGHLDMPVEAVRRVFGGYAAGKANAEGAKGAKFRNESAGGADDAELLSGDAAGAQNAESPSGNGCEKGSLRAGARGVLVGVSTHDEEQVRLAELGSADYVAIGPVFATSTKVDAEPVVGLEGVRRARALTGKPLVAIGGITRENAAAVREAGADSVAVIGGLTGSGVGVAATLQDFLRRLR